MVRYGQRAMGRAQGQPYTSRFHLGRLLNLKNIYIKKAFNNSCLFRLIGERQVMLENNETNKQQFGKLELVDKKIYYISFNTRDN
jgi:hypothetical protein